MHLNKIKPEKNIKKIAFLTLCTMLVLIAGVYLKNGKRQHDNLQNNDYKQESEEKVKFYALSGEEAEKQVVSLRPVAIMVENHPDSRPQSGLSYADIVYEALAEGGITRFLAFFQTLPKDSKILIGPVRSAREYFAQIAEEYGAIFAHVGGSNEVIAQIKNGQYPNLADINEYYNGEYFIRRSESLAPHHIFTNRYLLSLASETKGFKQELISDNFWKFIDQGEKASTTVSEINLDFSRPGYEVKWQYEQSEDVYKRVQYKSAHVDALNSQQLKAKSIVVQVVSVMPVPNDKLLSVDIDLAYGGRAVIFSGGRVVEGIWKKINGRTRYFDKQGSEISLSRGKIWVELLPKDKQGGFVWK